MKTKIFKTLALAVVFAVSVMGLSISTATERIAGETYTVTLTSLSSQATAHCEPSQWPAGEPHMECTEWGQCWPTGGGDPFMSTCIQY